jgi:Uma2 family endonuclease
MPRFLCTSFVVVGGPPRFSEEQSHAQPNPHLIIEVLAGSTEEWDRSGKSEHYPFIESFAEYVVIAQDRIYAEHWVRQPDGTWKFSATHRLDDAIELESLGARLTLGDAYEKVDLSGSAPAA